MLGFSSGTWLKEWGTRTPLLETRSFSCLHMLINPARFSSSAFVFSKSSKVSIRICCTLGSRLDLSKSRTTSMNFLSKLRVKLFPGLSVRMRMTIMALYCHEVLGLFSFVKYFRIWRAHSAAAAGEDSAASTMGGR